MACKYLFIINKALKCFYSNRFFVTLFCVYLLLKIKFKIKKNYKSQKLPAFFRMTSFQLLSE